MKEIEINVTDVINERYREFSMYTIEQRAIPSMIDGFKPVQRKAFYAAMKMANKEKCKVATLGSALPMMCNYHHGEASAQAAVVGMTQKFKNNIPIFEEHGSFGSRLITENSAPRYIFVKMNSDVYKYFGDWDILRKNPDPESPEPIYYLPLIPWLLVNGIKGIAVGFATDILPRDINDLIEACRLVAKGKKIDHLELVPKFPQFYGTVEKDGDKWIQRAPWTRKSPTKVVIDDIPTGTSREKYIEHLDKLIDSDKIVSYDDHCGRDKSDPESISRFKFVVTLPRSSKNLPDEKIESMLKLKKAFSENLTVIGPNNKLRIYEDIHSLIQDFVEFRLSIYSIRYAAWIKRDKAKLAYARSKLKFISDVLNNRIILKGKTRKQLSDELKKKFNEDYIQRFISLPVYVFCTDEIKTLEKEIKSLEKDIERWRNSVPEKDYLRELNIE